MKSQEITFLSLGAGLLLSIILGASNIYLGLKVGLTIASSIPGAILGIAILRIFKNKDILQNNIIQTTAASGGGLAAGIVFVLPALVLAGEWTEFPYWTTVAISVVGGTLGVLFTIPLRRTLLERKELPFPEGVAIAGILQSVSEEPNQSNATASKESEQEMMIGRIFKASLAAGLLKLLQGVSLLQGGFFQAFRSPIGIFAGGLEFSPALIGLGSIIGWRIALNLLIGMLIAWLVTVPWLSFGLGSENWGSDPVTLLKTAKTLWLSKVRYIGVGGMLIGGAWSLARVLAPLLKSKLFDRYAGSDLDQADLSPKTLLLLGSACIIGLFALFYQQLQDPFFTLVIGLVALFCGLIFSAIAGYITGLVGSSNNPVSHASILTILAVSVLVSNFLPGSGEFKIMITIFCAALVACASCIAGDNMQDLKTGSLIGATPYKQQIAQIVGVVGIGLIAPFILNILHKAYGFADMSPNALPAPQATVIHALTQAFFKGELEWEMMLVGMLVALVALVLNVVAERGNWDFKPLVMPIVMGIYLPPELTATLAIGGALTFFIPAEDKSLISTASGYIAGESILGIVLAFALVLGFKLDFGIFPLWLSSLVTVFVLGLFCWKLIPNRVKS